MSAELERWLTAGDAAPDVCLTDPRGEPLALASLWNGHPAVLVFVRHFGCPLCREQLLDIAREFSRFERAGAQVAAVGMGSAEEAGDLQRKLALPFTVLSDPDRRAYRAFGLQRGTWWQVSGPAVWAAGAKALWRGGIGIPRGDVFQLSGEFVIESGGTIRYAHRPQNSADQAGVETLLAVIEEMVPQATGDAQARGIGQRP